MIKKYGEDVCLNQIFLGQMEQICLLLICSLTPVSSVYYQQAERQSHPDIYHSEFGVRKSNRVSLVQKKEEEDQLVMILNPGISKPATSFHLHMYVPADMLCPHIPALYDTWALLTGFDFQSNPTYILSSRGRVALPLSSLGGFQRVGHQSSGCG